MTKITGDLIFESLKALQAGVAEINTILADNARLLIWAREDISALQVDDVRNESAQAQMDARLQRIENRLDLLQTES